MIFYIISLLRVLTLDNLNAVTNLLIATLSRISDKDVKADKIISENIKKYIDTCLKKQDDDTCDAKFPITTASLGANPANYESIRVRLGISKHIFKTVINS